MENNPLTGVLGLLMLLQLVVVLMILLGGLYALYCLNRAATGLDRLASAVENWVTQTVNAQARLEAQNNPLPSQTAADNADWLKPIELPVTTTASNQPVQPVPPLESVSAAPPLSGESEVRHD